MHIENEGKGKYQFWFKVQNALWGAYDKGKWWSFTGQIYKDYHMNAKMGDLSVLE